MDTIILQFLNSVEKIDQDREAGIPTKTHFRYVPFDDSVQEIKDFIDKNHVELEDIRKT